MVDGIVKRRIRDRLGSAKEEEAARLERVVEKVEEVLLQLALHVNQQVATADEVEPGERRVAQHAMSGEKHRLAKIAVDPVVVALSGKKAYEPLARNLGGNRGRVQSFTRDAQRALVEIGGKYLNLGRIGERVRILRRKYRQRIRFLSRGASNRPDSDGVFAALAFEEGGQGLLA